MRRRGSGCVPFRAKSSTAAKRTEHSRKHSEIFQNSTFDLLIIYNAEVLILEKDITIDKDEVEQEIEFNFDVENVLDGKELELEIIPKIIYTDKVIFDKKSVLIVGIGGPNE